MVRRLILSLSLLLIVFVAPPNAVQAENNASWADEIIYFVMLDRFADGDLNNNPDVDRNNPMAFQGGDLAGLRENLNEIADLGVTAIWITPIALQIEKPIKSDGKDFYPYHGYWAKNPARIDPRFGTEADLKALVDGAHGRGIKIILDVVYNHLGYGMENDPKFAPWLRSGDSCGGDDLTKCLSGLPDLRTELPEVRRYLFDAYIGLAKRVGLDGFRLDTVKQISHDFWQAQRAEVERRLGKDFLLIGEVWDADRFLAKPYFANDEMGALFDFSFRDRVVKLMNGSYDAARFGRYLKSRANVREGYFLAPFLSNHDMAMLLAVLKGDKEKLMIAATVLMSIEGPPVIVYGEEIGRRGSIWPNNRQVMAWGDKDILPGAGIERDENLRAQFKSLIALRKATPSLRGGEFKVVYSDNDVLIYQRGTDAIIAINRGAKASVTDMAAPDGNWRMAFSSVDGLDGAIFNLPPASARIFIKE